MKVSVIAVGKVKERFYRDAIDEFKKRLGRYIKLEMIEVPDEKTPDKAAEAIELQIKDKEGERILHYIKEDAYVIVLAIEGIQLDSVSLSNKLRELGVRGQSHIQFVIGGSLGLSKRVMERADYQLSFSPMTFPHQLMRVILLEQIYRGYRIMNNEPYHK